jgi:hypothetical protein
LDVAGVPEDALPWDVLALLRRSDGVLDLAGDGGGGRVAAAVSGV